MLFFLFGGKKKEDKNRIKLLDANEGVEFTTLIPDSTPNGNLAYRYEDVRCSITGNTDGMKEGAVLYVRKGGVVANAAKENIAQVKAKKLSEMIDEFCNPNKKSRFSSIRAKFVGVRDGELSCNLGFYIDDDIDDDDDDEDDE